MYIVTLAEAKKQLNIEPYFIDDDNYITSLIDVAFYSIKNRCNNLTWVDTSGVTTGNTDFADYTISGTTIPLPIKHAILLMVDNLYENRSPVTFSRAIEIPYHMDYLLMPYINYQSYLTTSITTNYYN
jgi:hypothetical protein